MKDNGSLKTDHIKTTTYTHRKMKQLIWIGLMLIFASSCDLVKPQKTFVLALAEDDPSYVATADQLTDFLQNGGYNIEIKKVSNAIEANKLVAKGQADLTLVKNHSLFVPEALKTSPSGLKTLMPLYTNLMLLYSKDISSLSDLGEEETRIKVEDIEAFIDLYEVFNLSEIHNVKITRKEEADLIYFWGTLYEDRSRKLAEEKWYPVSLDETWEEFLLLNNPALRRFKLPAIPGTRNSKAINTLASEVLLVCSAETGKKAIHDLSKYIFNHKLKLIEQDRMYRSINEHFNQKNLLYPLHEGTRAYLNRKEPSILKSYSELFAFIVALLAILFGLTQALRFTVLSRKKGWADQYYLDFLLVKESAGTSEIKRRRLDSLFSRSLTYMTQRKISKKDFHTLSRLIQNEQANLKELG